MVSLNYSPVIFLVLVMGDSLVVDQVEQSGEADSSLEEWSQTAVFGQTVLVVPAPVSSGQASSPCNGIVELSACKPGWKLVNFDLTKRQVRLAIVDGRVIGTMDSLVVAWRKLSQHLSSLKFLKSFIIYMISVIIKVSYLIYNKCFYL